MNPYTELAKKAVENYIKNKKIISPPKDLPEEFFKKRAGIFVTIKKNGNLRGCIGTYLPTKTNIAQEIIQNAISTATKDWRFEPLTEDELPHLSYTVYILSKPEPVKDLKELDPKKYGIIVKTSFKIGLLLPDLEGVDTAKKQISIACQKAGIDPLKEKIIIYRFTVEKYDSKK